MNEDLKYQEYLSNGGTLPYEEYISAATLFSQIESVDEDLKKKSQSDREWESEFNEWDTTISDGLTDIEEPNTRQRVQRTIRERTRPFFTIFGYHGRNTFYGLAIDSNGIFWRREL